MKRLLYSIIMATGIFLIGTFAVAQYGGVPGGNWNFDIVALILGKDIAPASVTTPAPSVKGFPDSQSMRNSSDVPTHMVPSDNKTEDVYLYELPVIINNANTHTITKRQAYNHIFINAGDADGTEFDLPPATPGMYIEFSSMVAQNIVIDPNGTDQILYETNAAGDSITSAGAIGNGILLVCKDTGYWIPCRYNGAWSDSN